MSLKTVKQGRDISTGQLAVVLIFVGALVAIMLSAWVAILYLSLQFAMKAIAGK